MQDQRERFTLRFEMIYLGNSYRFNCSTYGENTRELFSDCIRHLKSFCEEAPIITDNVLDEFLCYFLIKNDVYTISPSVDLGWRLLSTVEKVFLVIRI